MNFDNDPIGICREVLRVVKHWMSHGVRVFRVDNPHTKPVAFWEWLLKEIRRTDPDVIFLSEAFTRPPMMRALGAVGFHQSYTYFTWRTAKWELEQYLMEVSHESDHTMRPNFFVNTPDILHAYLQYGGPAAFKIRAAIAATGSPSWGVYAGYELFEHVAVKPGSEEYLDSEKYQIRIRDWDAAAAEGRTLAPYLTRLNEIRRAHPALRLLRNVAIHSSDDENVLVFSKVARARPPGSRRRRRRRRQPRPARRPRDDDPPRPACARARLGRLVHGPRRDHRCGVGLEPAQLRPARSRRRARAHPRCVRAEAMNAEISEAFPDTPEVSGTTPDWFKTAVFYEVMVRSFRDSNGDGTGDFKGLIEKLDYLAWLGVDCLWIPPFFTSPLRDGGYDVADYTDILPEIGTVEDFHELLDAAHQRGLRVIIDFVMNHTSDQHPWFQASRSDPDGPYGDFYVWSDTDEKYPDARIIFVDTEPSNWTWDPVRQQYFWHRFFNHQPDLNFDNPAVHDAILDAVSFWFDMGLDGFRLDAVPYLYEREGTNGENLKETHEFLRKVRRFVDDKYPGKVLLAEANQWPADVVDYFGDFEVGGDQCHMCFHFPVMPRIFMAVRRESRYPISEILEQTPPIPSGCQWGIFLRNHDELTLEMVTDEDRDYMWEEYAKDPRMKANIGIRRRLAPLLDNDTNRIELFSALLLSLPGSPVLYYGDEIGMGDNIWLGDRDGVRTPMQWTPDRNAGFSAATPGKLHLPAIQDPVYGYQSVNVEAQLENPSSLLHWTRRMIWARRRHDAFGLGSFSDLGGSNPTVLSYAREHDLGDGTSDVILCVNNLSRFPQPVELDLRRFEGMVPIELLGGVPFPAIGELPYLLTLSGYGFYWFRLTTPDAPGGPAPVSQPVSTSLDPSVLAGYLARTRWFGGKGRPFEVSDVRTLGVLPGGPPLVVIHLVEVTYGDAGPDSGEDGTELYQVPLVFYEHPETRLDHAFVGWWEDPEHGWVHAYDALHDREAMALWQRAFASAGTGARTEEPDTEEQSGLTFHRLTGHQLDLEAHSTLFSGEQSNSSVAFGEDALMKVFRKVTPGANPDITVHAELTRAESEHIAALYGWLEVADPADPDGGVLQLAMLQEFLRTATRRVRARAGQRPHPVRRRRA